EAREVVVEQRDLLDVDGGLGDTVALAVDLVELPVAPLLRALAAEHRADEEPLLHALDVAAVLDVRAHEARRRLGAQREPLLALVLPLVHLLLDDVGRLADAAREQRRWL